MGRRTPVDFTTSFLDLCCCALGAVILLMVLLVPIPHPRGAEAEPVVRPLDLSLRLPCAWPLGTPADRPLELTDAGVFRPMLGVATIDHLELRLAERVLFAGPLVIDGPPQEVDSELGPLRIELLREPLELGSAPFLESLQLSQLAVELALATSTEEEVFLQPFALELTVELSAPQQPVLRDAEQLWQRFLALPQARQSRPELQEAVFPQLRLGFFPDLDTQLSLRSHPMSHWDTVARTDFWVLAFGVVARPGLPEEFLQPLPSAEQRVGWAQPYQSWAPDADSDPESAIFEAWVQERPVGREASALRWVRPRFALGFRFQLAPRPGSGEDGSLPALELRAAEGGWLPRDWE